MITYINLYDHNNIRNLKRYDYIKIRNFRLNYMATDHISRQISNLIIYDLI